MDSGNQTPADQVKVEDVGNTFVSGASAADGSASMLAAGTVVADKYKIIQLIGHGGMGSVYKVEQVLLRQMFALKTLTGQNFPEVAVRRFQKEAQAASKLNHPNLVRAHDFGILGSHLPFYVMDLIVGENLSDYSKKIGTLPIEEVLRIFIPVCFALGYAHSEGIIHRDIKPGNIMLDKSQGEDQPPTPKVVDFGIAKLTDSEDGHSVNLTRTGEIFGTPLYMSPEQCLGTRIDHRTDIYSLGCVMYEALTGAPPFHGESALSLMMKHQTQEAPSLKEASLGREFPEALETIVSKTMAKDPDARYQSLLDLAHDLAILQQENQQGSTANLPSAKSLPNLIKQAPKKAGQVPLLITAALSLTCLAIGIGLGMLCSSRPSQTVKPIASAVDESIVQEVGENVGSREYVITRGRGAGAMRTYQFPGSFSIGSIQYADFKTGKASEEIPAKGNIEIPAGNFVQFHVKKNDLFNHPQLMRGFGETDINALHLDNESRSLEEAVVFNPDVVFDAALAYCSKMQYLTRLIAWNVPLTDAGLRCLQDLPRLYDVEVSNSKVSPAAIRSLKNFPGLNELGISGMKDGKTLIPQLKDSKTLSILNATLLDLDDNDVIALSNVKTLVALNIRENPKVTEAAIKHFQNHPNMRYLYFAGTSVTAKIIPTLIAMKNLQAIDVDKKFFSKKDCQYLQSMLPKTQIVGFMRTPRKLDTWDWKNEP